jgi:hypothetical protein
MEEKTRISLDQTVLTLSEYIKQCVGSNMADLKKDLPELVASLAMLVESIER